LGNWEKKQARRAPVSGGTNSEPDAGLQGREKKGARKLAEKGEGAGSDLSAEPHQSMRMEKRVVGGKISQGKKGVTYHKGHVKRGANEVGGKKKCLFKKRTIFLGGRLAEKLTVDQLKHWREEEIGSGSVQSCETNLVLLDLKAKGPDVEF